MLFSAMLTAPLVRAEQTVQWADLPKIVKKAQRGWSREFTIVTKGGEKTKSRQLMVSASGLLLEPDWRMIPKDQVSEIQVRHRGRLSYFGWLEGKRPPDPDFGYLFDPVAWLILPFDLAFGAVATPPMLAIEGSRRLRPAKVFKIQP